MTKVIVAFSLFFTTVSIVSSQNVVEANASACELNSLYADGIYTVAKNEKDKISVVAYRGEGETDVVNKKRLALVKAFLTHRKGWTRYDPIYAIGDSVDEQGRIDIYVGNTLYWVIRAKKNFAPCMDCCDFDYLSSPGYLATKPKKQKSKKTLKR